jgi:crotonobetainyl-CoA:carnitine CoA-transferase CaiB-like acyl-CoA transferase
MEQAGDRLRQMLREMDRLHQDPQFLQQQDRVRDMDQLQERVQNMVREMDHAQQALRRLALP